MFAIRPHIRAVAIALSVSALSGITAFPQSLQLARQAVYSPGGTALSVSDSCLSDTQIAKFAPRPTILPENPFRPSCETAPITRPIATSVPTPCDTPMPVRTGCVAPEDSVRMNLEATAKEGHKISRAREVVLAILDSENACTAWYREKDVNPRVTFRTLSFAVDRKAEDYVHELKEPGSYTVFRNPYVARVMQADGPYATITINAKGAFFFSMARVIQISKEGGPFNMASSPRVLHVGPYQGDTLAAQVTTLLHEFGHLVDLLASDEGDQDGKSVHNTDIVLHNCRPEIESRTRPNSLTATR